VNDPSDRQHRVLIGTVGTTTSWGLLVSLREAFDGTYVVGTDTEPAYLVAASSLCDRFEVAPAIEEESFAATLLALIDNATIDTYFPIHDAEIVVAARLRDEGRLNDVICPVPPTWAAQLCRDKLAAAKWLTEEGFPTPRTCTVDAVPDVDSGWIVKPRYGVGSVGVEAVRSADALDRWQSCADRDAFVAQELMLGPEVTLDCFLGTDGRARAVCRERIEIKTGVSTKARVFEDSELEQLAIRIGKRLGLRGAYCLQVMRDDVGGENWYVTDINPRPGAGTRLSVAAGVNVHAAMMADLWGFDSEPYLARLGRERWVVRHYEEIVLA
jgi:predicted ATP-grasp superfamily ATP-dependent carboligase